MTPSSRCWRAGSAPTARPHCGCSPTAGTLGAARTLTINRLHRLLVKLVPGGAKEALTARQARALLAQVREPAHTLAGGSGQDLRAVPLAPGERDRPSAVLLAVPSRASDLRLVPRAGAARLGPAWDRPTLRPAEQTAVPEPPGDHEAAHARRASAAAARMCGNVCGPIGAAYIRHTPKAIREP